MSSAYIAPELTSHFSEPGLFAQLDALSGEVYRELAGRRTLRFEAGGNAYFAKIHKGVGWREIIKNLSQAKLPVIGASNEWRALERLAQIGIRAPEPVLYVNEGGTPATRRSGIVTKALCDMISLEDYIKRPDFGLAAKRALLPEVARVTRVMHDSGVNHRDYYLCHFLVSEKGVASGCDVFLIDLHRAQIRSRTPQRWRVKDLGGLLFSALDMGLTRRDLYRFIKLYTGLELRDALRQRIWRRVAVRARRLYLESNPTLSRDASRLLAMK